MESVWRITGPNSDVSRSRWNQSPELAWTADGDLCFPYPNGSPPLGEAGLLAFLLPMGKRRSLCVV